MQATGKLVIGTVQFGLDYGINNTAGRPSQDQVNRLLDFAFRNGVSILDSAEAYGDAHEVIGNYHAQSPNRFSVITKYSPSVKDLPGEFGKRLNVHLEKMKLDRLYAYMFHSADDLKKYYALHKEEILGLKDAGLISRFGVSVYTNRELCDIVEAGIVDLIQLPFNLLDNFAHRGELLQKAKDKGIEIHSRSAFLQGLFFRDPADLPGKLNILSPYLQRLRDVALKSNVEINSWALNYAVGQQLIDKVVIGVDTVEQLKQNLGHLQDGEIPDPDFNVKERALLNPARWNKGKVLAITQARMGSTRLPGKVMLETGGIPLLKLHLDRLFLSEKIDQFIVATTTDKKDDTIVSFCESLEVTCSRGSEQDVLDRYYQAALPNAPEWVVRITGDCPLIDARVVDDVIDLAINSGADYCSNTLLSSFPDGMDVEVIKFDVLKQAWKEATLKSDREHVTPFIYNNSVHRGQTRFTSENLPAPVNYGDVRLTVDDPADFQVIDKLVNRLGPDKSYREYAELYQNDSSIHSLNNHTKRNEGYKASLKKDK